MGHQTSKDPDQSEVDRQSIEEATALAPRLIYELIRREGEEEINRTARSLIWSGIAAGILISFSVLGEAIFRTYLPDTPARFLIENLGYSFGFLLVILGRMQLFTENTITTVVPVTLSPTWKSLGRTGRLWGVVLAANVAGAFIAAAFLAFTPVMSAPMAEAMVELSHHATGMPWAEGLVRGIPAGVLIAALVWMLPQANGSALPLIIIITWLIALGDFTHIIAGSVEMAFLMVQGELSLGPAVFRFFLPVLAGNVIGGTAVFTLLTWAQIRPEVEEAKEKRNGGLKT